MTISEAALQLHDNELEITCYYLRLINVYTRVILAEELVHKCASEFSAKQTRPEALTRPRAGN